MSWVKEKNWSDRFLPEIKSIIGRELIAEAPLQEDMKRNTDLIVLKLDAVRIACRVRRNCYLDKYGDEFTLRSKVKGGGEAELHKVISGWGDYFFYGISDTEEKRLQRWSLCNLNIFRLWFARQIIKNKGVIAGFGKDNFDGTGFRAFRFVDMPDGFIVAKNW